MLALQLEFYCSLLIFSSALLSTFSLSWLCLQTLPDMTSPDMIIWPLTRDDLSQSKPFLCLNVITFQKMGFIHIVFFSQLSPGSVWKPSQTWLLTSWRKQLKVLSIGNSICMVYQITFLHWLIHYFVKKPHNFLLSNCFHQFLTIWFSQAGWKPGWGPNERRVCWRMHQGEK